MVACPRWMCFVLHVVGPLACASSIFPLFFFPPRPWLIPRLLSPLSPSMEVSIPSPPRQRSSLPWRTARLRAMSVFRRPAGWWHSSGAHPTPLKVQGGGAHMFGSTPPASCRRRLVGVLLCQPVYRTDASAPFCDAVHPPPPAPYPLPLPSRSPASLSPCGALPCGPRRERRRGRWRAGCPPPSLLPLAAPPLRLPLPPSPLQPAPPSRRHAAASRHRLAVRRRQRRQQGVPAPPVGASPTPPARGRCGAAALARAAFPSPAPGGWSTLSSCPC